MRSLFLRHEKDIDKLDVEILGIVSNMVYIEKQVDKNINDIKMLELNGGKGEMGAQGQPGSKGEMGMQGQHGPKGEVGSKGEPGVKGEIGNQGQDGEKG